jgi:hypothetical protein
LSVAGSSPAISMLMGSPVGGPMSCFAMTTSAPAIPAPTSLLHPGQRGEDVVPPVLEIDELDGDVGVPAAEEHLGPPPLEPTVATTDSTSSNPSISRSCASTRSATALRNSGRVPLGTSIRAMTCAGGMDSGKYSTPLLNTVNSPTLPTNVARAAIPMMTARWSSDQRSRPSYQSTIRGHALLLEPAGEAGHDLPVDGDDGECQDDHEQPR